MLTLGDIIGRADGNPADPALFLGGTLEIWVTSFRQALRAQGLEVAAGEVVRALRALEVAPALPALADQLEVVPLPPPDRCPGCGRPYC